MYPFPEAARGIPGQPGVYNGEDKGNLWPEYTTTISDKYYNTDANTYRPFLGAQ